MHEIKHQKRRQSPQTLYDIKITDSVRWILNSNTDKTVPRMAKPLIHFQACWFQYVRMMQYTSYNVFQAGGILLEVISYFIQTRLLSI